MMIMTAIFDTVGSNCSTITTNGGTAYTNIESNELKITSPGSEPFKVEWNVNDVAKLEIGLIQRHKIWIDVKYEQI